MISILYNHGDFEAASIALKAQSLAQTSAVNKIYIVPKHYGRNQNELTMNLKKTKIAIFISHDIRKFDEDTKKELEFLKQKSIPIHYLVPTTFNNKLIGQKTKTIL